MNNYIEVITGGSGEPWTRHSLLKASLKKIRDTVMSLLREHKIPIRLERGLESEKDPVTGKRDSSRTLSGIAGPFTIYYRIAGQEEYDEFDYDAWLVRSFKEIKI